MLDGCPDNHTEWICKKMLTNFYSKLCRCSAILIIDFLLEVTKNDSHVYWIKQISIYSFHMVSEEL